MSLRRRKFVHYETEDLYFSKINFRLSRNFSWQLSGWLLLGVNANFADYFSRGCSESMINRLWGQKKARGSILCLNLATAKC